ncbi:unnamed protein product [Effrenium voratum]|nr:unnamed protein product [Effrenium voratum]
MLSLGQPRHGDLPWTRRGHCEGRCSRTRVQVVQNLALALAASPGALCVSRRALRTSRRAATDCAPASLLTMLPQEAEIDETHSFATGEVQDPAPRPKEPSRAFTLAGWTVDSDLLGALNVAHQEALRAKHRMVSEDSLVFGLLSVRSVAAKFCPSRAPVALARVTARLAMVPNQVEVGGPGVVLPGHMLPISRTIQETMAEALEWQKLLQNGGPLAPEHVALALLQRGFRRKNAGVMYRLLKKLHLQVADLRCAMLLALPGPRAAHLARHSQRLHGLSRDGAGGGGLWPQRLASALNQMTSGLTERHKEAKILLLAAVAGEHVLLLGPPGTGKSMLAQRLAALCRGSFFEQLLTRFTVPEEVFGPMSLISLQDDKLERKVAGYLPTADVAFLDEVFKANPGVLNSLMTVLNERAFDNGPLRQDIPLWCLVGASNELPDSEALNALYDRFLLRSEVAGISDRKVHDFLRTALNANADPDPIAGKAAEETEKILDCQVCQQACAEAMLLEVPDRLLATLTRLRCHLQSKQVLLSDRRLVRAVKVLRVAAHAMGGVEVCELDLLLVQHIFWDRPSQSQEVIAWLHQDLLEAEERALRATRWAVQGFASSERPSVTVTKRAMRLRDILEEQFLSWQKLLAAVRARLRAAQSFSWLEVKDLQALASKLLPQVENLLDQAELLLMTLVAKDVSDPSWEAPVPADFSATSDAELENPSIASPEEVSLSLLQSAPGIGPKLVQKLLAAFGSADAVLHASRGALARVPGIGPRRANQLFALDPRAARDARDASEVKSAADLARGSKKPAGKPKKKAPVVAAQDSDGEDAKF